MQSSQEYKPEQNSSLTAKLTATTVNKFSSSACVSVLVLVLVVVLGDDELQSQSAVDAHIFPMLVQTVFEHIN